MKLTKLAAAAAGVLAVTGLSQVASAFWYESPNWAVNGGSMLVWPHWGETVQYGAGYPVSTQAASVNLTTWSTHRVRTMCSNGVYKTSATAAGVALYHNVTVTCASGYTSSWAAGSLNQ